MAKTTIYGHVSRALDFYNKSDLFFGIGRSEPWDDEYNPPVPGDRDLIEDLIAMKKVESKFIVYPSDDGELSYQGTKWKISSPERAFEDGARWVYVMAKLSYSEIDTAISFRQIGLYSGVQHTAGEGAYVLNPSDIIDEGILEILDNRKAVYREPTQQEQLILIINF